MLVTMRRTVFDSLDRVELARACMAPAIEQIRGKDLTVKSQVYAQLTAGQRALLMFWVLYGHAANGIAQFYCEVAYLLEQTDIWAALKAGSRYFRDNAMLRLLDEMEGVYHVLAASNRFGSAEWRGVDGDSELLASFDRLDAMFHEIIPATFERIDAYIRNHPDEFVKIED